MFLNLSITIHLLSKLFAIPFFILFPFVFVELPQYRYLIKLSVDVSGSHFLTLTSAWFWFKRFSRAEPDSLCSPFFVRLKAYAFSLYICLFDNYRMFVVCLFCCTCFDQVLVCLARRPGSLLDGLHALRSLRHVLLSVWNIFSVAKIWRWDF